MEKSFWSSLISLETSEHTCARAYVNEYSRRPFGFLETEAERTQSFTNTLLGSLVYFQASFIPVLRGKSRRGSPTQDSSVRTQLGQNP